MKLAGHSQSWSKLEKRFVQNFSVKTSVVHFIKKNPAWCNNVSEFYYSIFIWSSTCFGRHTVSDNVHQLHVQTTFHVWKTIGCRCSIRLLTMGGVSPETCWASCKFGIIKFWYIVSSCWIFLHELNKCWKYTYMHTCKKDMTKLPKIGCGMHTTCYPVQTELERRECRAKIFTCHLHVYISQ